MEELIRILTEGNYSLVLEKDGQRYTFTQRGVADLHALYHAPEHLLDGAMLENTCWTTRLCKEQNQEL